MFNAPKNPHKPVETKINEKPAVLSKTNFVNNSITIKVYKLTLGECRIILNERKI